MSAAPAMPMRVVDEATRQAAKAAVDACLQEGWTRAALAEHLLGLGISKADYDRAIKAGEPVSAEVHNALAQVSIIGLPKAPRALLTPRPAEIRKHLEWLTEPARGAYDDALIEIAWAPSLEHGITRAELFGLDELDAAVNFATNKSSEGVNVYVGASLKDPEADRHHRTTGDAFYVATAVPIDIDQDYDATRAKMASVCDDGLVVVTGMIPERRSQHWTRLSEPCDDEFAFGHAFAALVAHTGADMRVKDHARVMRLGGTVNYPTKAKQGRGYKPELTAVTVREQRPAVLETLQALAPDQAVLARFDASGRTGGPTGIERGGMFKTGPVENGREEWFRNRLLEDLRDFQENQCGADPTADELWEMSFGAFSDPVNVKNDDGRWTCPDGQKQLRARVENTLRRLRSGQLAKHGLYSYETGIRKDEAEQAKRDREATALPPQAVGVAPQPGEVVDEVQDAITATPAATPQRVFDPWQQWATPGFPLDTLPPLLRSFCEAQAASSGADVSACAMAVLAACSGALDHGFSLKMKRSGSWQVSPRLWVMLVGSSSAKKTPAISSAMAPLRAHDAKLAEDYSRDLARWMEAKEANEKAGADKPALPLRLIANVTTSEKLGEILSRQTRGLLVEQDELSGWLGAMDKYSGGKGGSADRAFWLKTYDGGPKRIDTISRGEAFIKNCSVSLLGGIQPRKLEEMGNLSADGLLQRFLPVMMRRAERPDEVDDAAVTTAYRELVGYLLAVKPCQLLMDDAALEAAKAFQGFTYDMEMVDGLGESFCSFLGKLNGVHGSLMLLLHMLRDPKEGPYTPVGRQVAEDAAKILRDFAIPHALALYRQSADGADWDYLRSLASYVLTSSKDRFTVSDFTSGVHSLRGMGVWEVGQKVSPLVAGGWLEEEESRGVVKAWTVVGGLRELLAERRQEEATRKAETMRAYRELGR